MAGSYHGLVSVSLFLFFNVSHSLFSVGSQDAVLSESAVECSKSAFGSGRASGCWQRDRGIPEVF